MKKSKEKRRKERKEEHTSKRDNANDSTCIEQSEIINIIYLQYVEVLGSMSHTHQMYKEKGDQEGTKREKEEEEGRRRKQKEEDTRDKSNANL